MCVFVESCEHCVRVIFCPLQINHNADIILSSFSLHDYPTSRNLWLIVKTAIKDLVIIDHWWCVRSLWWRCLENKGGATWCISIQISFNWFHQQNLPSKCGWNVSFFSSNYSGLPKINYCQQQMWLFAGRDRFV